ncbi:MAG: thiamine phosphate synthase [Planctomycetota bacterium]|nr:thiamine phosphate synthase [Planctomycetota bacterium]
MNAESILRILDVNRNRCFEALRVVEEYTRFVLNSQELSGRIKSLRHKIHSSFSHEGLNDLSQFRDSAGDVGRPGQTPISAGSRDDIKDVLGANLSRGRESLRALEEYSRPRYLSIAQILEKCRYDFYQLEKDILDFATRDDLRTRLLNEPLCLLLTPAPQRPSLLDMAKRAHDGGCRFFQLRLKKVDDLEFYHLASELGEYCNKNDILFVINDRADIAKSIPGTGLHLGQNDLPVSVARDILGERRFLGVSLHNLTELKATLTEEVDYVGIGTIFSSPTKPELGESGPRLLEEITPGLDRASFAIGGVNVVNVGAAIRAGATGVAVSSSILDASDITKMTAQVMEQARVAREARSEK